MPKEVKCLMYVGRGGYSASLFINYFKENSSSWNYLTDAPVKSIVADGITVKISCTYLDDNQRINRDQFLKHSNVFILFFSLFDREYFVNNIIDYADRFRRCHDDDNDATIILASHNLKTDNDSNNDDNLWPISNAEISKIMQEANISSYVAVDAKTDENLNKVFEEAAKNALAGDAKKRAAIIQESKQTTLGFKEMFTYPSTTASSKLINTSSKKNAIAPVDLTCLILEVPKTYDFSMSAKLEYALHKSKNKEITFDDLIFNNGNLAINLVVNNTPLNLKTLTKAGQEEFATMQETYYREANVYILLFSFFDYNSLQGLREIATLIRRVKDIDENEIAPIIVASYDNKESLEDKSRPRKVDANDLKKIINIIKPAAYIPVDVKAMQNLDQLLEETFKITLEKRTETKLPDEFLLDTKQPPQIIPWFKKLFSQNKPAVVQPVALQAPNESSSSRSSAPPMQQAERTKQNSSAQATRELALTMPKEIPEKRSQIQGKQEVINSLSTTPGIDQYQLFLKELPLDDLELLKTIKENGGNLNQLLLTLSQIKTNQAVLQHRLETVEMHSELDPQSQAEISYIQSHENLNRYYQALKMLLGQTFMAAKVISSGEVNAVKGIGATMAGVLIKGTAGPFAGFATLVVDKIDATNSYRSMLMLSSWAAPEDIAKLAAKTARRLVIAQEHYLARGLTPTAKKMVQKIKENCSLLFERIHSGKALTIEQERALLDAKEILTYMKENEKPKNANLAECVDILLRIIMGEDYEYEANPIVVQAQQTSIATTAPSTTATDINTTNQPRVITQEEWETIQKQLAESKKATESTQKELELLRSKAPKSNANTTHTVDNNDGTVSLQLQEMVNTPHGPMPLNIFLMLKDMQSEVAIIKDGVATTSLATYQIQERFGAVKKDAEETPNEQMRNALFQGSSFSYQQKKK